MRRVTFSTPEIQTAIRDHFVALNTNIEGDPTAGQSVQHRPSDQPGSCIRGNGRQNVQTLFLTPDLQVFHVASGFQSPEDLYEEMQFAANLFSQIRDKGEDPAQVVHDSHVARLSDAGFSEDQIHAANDVELLQSMMAGAMRPGNGSFDPAFMRNGSRSGTDGAGMFAAMERHEFLKDQRFAMKYPLISLDRFESDPGALVGRGKTFFSSSSNSSN